MVLGLIAGLKNAGIVAFLIVIDE